MLPEALVIFACLNSTGCTETSRHYYNTHPQIQVIAKKTVKIAKQYVGTVVIDTVGPVLFAAAGGTGTIRLGKHLSLQLNRDSAILGLGLEF
jgi:hypothetical protein